MKMTLQFDVNIGWAKNLHQSLNGCAGRLWPSLRQSGSQRSFFSAGQANQTISIFNKVLTRRDGSFFASHAQLHFRDQAAQVLISSTRSDQQRKPETTRREARVPCGDGTLPCPCGAKPRHHTRWVLRL